MHVPGTATGLACTTWDHCWDAFRCISEAFHGRAQRQRLPKGTLNLESQGVDVQREVQVACGADTDFFGALVV